MRRKLLLGVVGALGIAGSWTALGSPGGSAQALGCPSALGAACGPVDLAVATACYSDIPQLPTIGFVTIQSSGRVVTCPEL